MDVKVVQAFFEDLLRRMQTDYIDLGMIHMIDNAQEYEEIFSGPILEYALELKQKGLIHALGVSCHNPVQALRAAKTGLIDLMLFSVNPAYDVLNENAERPRKLNNRFSILCRSLAASTRSGKNCTATARCMVLASRS